jgi:hypothetical protein
VPDDTAAVEKAMAAASIRPHTEFREDKATRPWHFIDICLQDKKEDLPARCPQGIVSQQKSMSMRSGCVTGITSSGEQPVISRF